MQSLPSQSLDFLRDLSTHNDKAWFQTNKKRYESDLKLPARALVDAVNARLDDIAPAYVTPPNKALNRINRDIRFSKDKTPYNTHVWAAFRQMAKPKGESAGLYFGIHADGSVGTGAGCWMPPKENMLSLRRLIAGQTERWVAIVEDAAFVETYGALLGDAYKRVPAPFDADHPAAEYLKFKGMHVKHDLGQAATDDDLVDRIAADFIALKPFVDFIDEGLSG